MRQWRISSAIAAVGLVLSLLVFIPPAAQAQSNMVTVGEGESIQAALDAAEPGTTITVEAGVYEEALVISTDGITLKGEPGATISPGASTDGCEFFGVYDAICIADGYFVDELGQTDATDTISDVTVTGFTLNDITGAAIGVVRGTNIEISNNKVSRLGCDGIYVIKSKAFTVNKNIVREASGVFTFCNGISVLESAKGSVTKNSVLNGSGTGLLIAGSAKVTVTGNKVRGNCGGILVSTPNGKSESVRGVKILKNKVSKNNKTCQPFLAIGSDATIGGFGIGVAGGDKVTVKRNKVTNNVVSDPALMFPAAGIFIFDAPDLFTDEVLTTTKRVTVTRNKVTGNTTNGVDTDILVLTESKRVKVTKNTCVVSRPDPAWCGG